MFNDVSKPLIIKSEAGLNKLLKENPHLYLVDAFERQLKELFFIDNKSFIGQEKSKVYKTEEFQKYVKEKDGEYYYIYYPWNCHVVKCVKEKNYFRLKTNRNQDLITHEEQEKLADYKTAVLGMSVGSNIAFVLTQAGISKNMILADFDELDTTNLNRIWAGVHQVGLNKAVVASRRIYEDNPYANIKIYKQGISVKILEEELKRKNVDLIVEEIDNLPLKIEIRKLALKYKTPVLMVTDNGDGIILHVERFDLGYTKIFNKTLEYWEKIIPTISDISEMGKLIVEVIIGGKRNVDTRVEKSVKKVMQRKLISWPQLGAAALFGGVVSTVVIKKMLFGKSAKKYIFESYKPL